MTIPYGGRAIEAAAALDQRPDGMRLIELAQVLQAPLSSAQRAVSSLADDGLITPIGEQPDRRYVLNRHHPATRALVEFALRKLPAQEAVDLTSRANPAVAFAGRDEAGYVLVLSPAAEPSVVLRLSEALELINRDRPDPRNVEIVDRDELRRQLFEHPEVRERGLRMTAVKGSVVRAFRNPHEHGSVDAVRLGRLHPSLPRIAPQAIRRLAQKHGLSRVVAFGSAVRADFRPDSDIDVLIEPRADVRLKVRDLIELRQELESMFERDVDIVTAGGMRAKTPQHAVRDEVVLYG
jgi:Predicted nucleotidyltransferases